MHTGAPDSIQFPSMIKFLLNIGFKFIELFGGKDVSHCIHYKRQVQASVAGFKLVVCAVNCNMQSLEPSVHGPPVTMPLARKSAGTNRQTAITRMR